MLYHHCCCYTATAALQFVTGWCSYIAPEVLNQQIELIDERADMWGLGVLLFVLLSAEPPWPLEEVTNPVRLWAVCCVSNPLWAACVLCDQPNEGCVLCDQPNEAVRCVTNPLRLNEGCVLCEQVREGCVLCEQVREG